MAFGHEQSLLLAQSYPLADGGRVRLRLARRRDGAGIETLLERHGVALGELELARLVRFDPRALFVVCATRLVEGREAIVGVGAIGLGEDAIAEPNLLIVDEELGEQVRELLRGALVSRAIASTRQRAA